MTSSTPQGPRLGRRSLIAGATAGALAAGVAAAPAGAASGDCPIPFRNSLSVSPFTEAMLSQGLRFTDGSTTASTLRDVQSLFRRHGSTEMFARIATRRSAPERNAEHGLDAGLTRARLAKRLRTPLNPELGLWAVYGDISHQPGPDFGDYPGIVLPGPWATLTIEQMTAAMREYGRQVAAQILATGAEVEIWDVGNEVEFGVAGVGIRSFTEATDYWTYEAPDNVDPAIGRMSVWDLFYMPDRNQWLAEHLWPYTGAIFAAVAEGVRTVDPAARFSTHTSTTALQLPGLTQAFYLAMADAGFEVDELGVSYYPTSTAEPDALASFKLNASALSVEFDRPVFIAETGYPSSPMGPPFEWNNPVPGYPIDQTGEYEFFRELARWGAESGVLSGIRQWAPDYPVAEWAPMSHFSVAGTTATAEPVLDAVADGVQAAQQP